MPIISLKFISKLQFHVIYYEMGNILELTAGYFAPTARCVSTQTETVFTRTVGTQTKTKLTEKLTDFNNLAVSSTEVFDKICDICNLDKEAVGYCWNCEQYLCFRCCGHHEKISLSQEHRLIGKSDFPEIGLKKSLFGLSIVAFKQQCLPQCIRSNCNDPNYCTHHYSLHENFYVKSFQATCFMLYEWQERNYAFVTIDKKGKYKRHTICRLSHYSKDKSETILNYISFNKTVCVLIFTTDETVSLRNMFEVGGECKSVVPFNSGLAVLICISTGYLLPEWQIQFLDMVGNVKKQICYDAAGQPIFKTPEKMIVKDTGDALFVCDRTKQCIIALDKAGNFVYTFKHTEIWSPTKLACDDEGNVYVVCKNKVVQIDSHGKNCRMLLNSDKKCITEICYNPSSRQLVVTDYESYNKQKVTLFSLQ